LKGRAEVGRRAGSSPDVELREVFVKTTRSALRGDALADRERYEVSRTGRREAPAGGGVHADVCQSNSPRQNEGSSDDAHAVRTGRPRRRTVRSERGNVDATSSADGVSDYLSGDVSVIGGPCYEGQALSRRYGGFQGAGGRMVSRAGAGEGVWRSSTGARASAHREASCSVDPGRAEPGGTLRHVSQRHGTAPKSPAQRFRSVSANRWVRCQGMGPSVRDGLVAAGNGTGAAARIGVSRRMTWRGNETAWRSGGALGERVDGPDERRALSHRTV